MKKIYFVFNLALLFVISTSVAQEKKVLFEEFTNASCGPCAANNPFLKSYIDSKGDTIVAIKYHTNFPGFDPMYNLNPTQVEERRTGYYSDVNAVPWLKGDGNMFPDIWPFTLANLDAAFNTRKSVIPQLTMSVVDVRISQDSISSIINIIIPSTLPSGNYKLRVMAVEKEIIYSSPPGNNGERIFEHVFRRGYPDMQGTDIPTTLGNHQFIFKYKIAPEWNDTSIYTVAFVQNDASNKEVINCAKGNSTTTSVNNYSIVTPGDYSLYQNYPNPFNPMTKIKFDIPSNSRLTNGQVNRQTSNVKLTVYDALGKAVAMLINEELSAGGYEIEFDGSNYSSGIYFYKLESGNFNEIKKMMLLK